MKKSFFVWTVMTVFHSVLFVQALTAMEIHGFISQGYLKSDHNNYLADTKDGSLEFNELGINFSTKLAPLLTVGLQLFSYDLGDVGNNELQIDWAYADYRFREWLGLRVGKIKVPLGIYNEIRDVDMIRTCIFLPQSVYQEHHRYALTATKGIGAYGLLKMKRLGNIRYQFQGGIFDVGRDSGAQKIFESDTGDRFDVQDIRADNVFAGKLTWHMPLDGAFMAASALRTRLFIDTLIRDTAAGVEYSIPLINIEILSAGYTWKDVTLTMEHAYLIITSAVEAAGYRATQTSEGYYGGVTYRLSELLEIGAYYSEYYYKKGDTNGEESLARGRILGQRSDYAFQFYQKDTCLSLRFDLFLNWIVKLEGHKMAGVGSLYAIDNYDEHDNLDLDKDWFLFATKFTYSF